MTHYAGLDVSLKEVSICVVDDDGEVVAQGTAPADPEGVAGWFKNRSLTPKRIIHESGQLSIWLQRGMVQMGLPAICIDARKAHKSLSARLNKSDSSDAEGLAQLARMNWFTPVHIRSEESDRLRALVGGRERMIRLRKDLEGHIRCRFLGRPSRRLSDADRCLASEKRSSGKSRGWAWWVVYCYGDLGGGFASDPIWQAR